ncbi:MAG: lipopolysaccharide heptosyltransferase I [Desulfatiglandales bacterium]|nr:lipopolysaccharide heptosyltransferase I [Desulfatiglandales bacterium]
MGTKRPNSILIVKLSAIGDVVHSLPLLEVLRKNFPEARIDWVVEEESSELIQAHKGIDHVIVSRRKSWQKNFFRKEDRSAAFREIIRFFRELRSEEYELVIDLQGLFKSALLTGLSRGKRKIGASGGREGSPLVLTEQPYPVGYNQHAVDRYLKITEYLKCSQNSWEGLIPIRESDRRSMDRLIHDNGIQNKIKVAINPIARWKTKLWELNRFGILADRLQKELSCRVIFTGGRDDRANIDKIIARMEEKPVNLAGQTSLKELAYLYSICGLLISTDTGPMHIAAAMDCPVIALFGPTAPWRTGPYGKGHKVIREGIECSPCFKKRCTNMACMDNITADRVFDAVQQVFNDLRDPK